MKDTIQLTPREIEDRLEDGIARLTKQNQVLDRLAKEKAKTEQEYRTELAKKIETLRAGGVTATTSKDRAKGSDDVKEYLYKRDLKEIRWRAQLEITRNIRLEIEVLRSLLTQLRAEAKNMM